MTDTITVASDTITITGGRGNWSVKVRGIAVWNTANRTQAEGIAQFLEYHGRAAETIAAEIEGAAW